MSTFETFERTESALYGGCAGIWVMIVHAPPIARDMSRARSSLQTMAARHREGFPALTWVLPSAGLAMRDDAREAAAEVTKSFARSLVAEATLIESTGFQAAAIRAIVATLDLVSRIGATKKVFSDLQPATAWTLSRRVGAPPAADETAVVAAIREARRAVDATR